MKIKPTERLANYFWNHVNKSDGCWEWTGNKSTNGYGSMIVIPAVRMNAHRVSYILNKGEIPEGYVILHQCDNPSCVKPEHLSTGTQLENIRDMIGKGRQNFYHRRKLTLEQMENIRKEYIPGKVTHKMLAEKYGVTRTNISYLIRGKSWKEFPEGVNAIDQRRSLTPSQIQEIKSSKGKISWTEISKKFRISKTTIYRQWKNIPPTS